MDFNATRQRVCEQILFEHCYGYPLSGEFIRIDYCYDIPRVLHCHVNPANLRYFRGGYSRAVIDSVVARKTFTYAINHTDNAVLMDVFTFGLTAACTSVRQPTAVTVSTWTASASASTSWGRTFSRNWQIWGSIIANTIRCGRSPDRHRAGHTALSNVETFSGGNRALTT
jgi:hypothetical protein